MRFDIRGFSLPEFPGLVLFQDFVYFSLYSHYDPDTCGAQNLKSLGTAMTGQQRLRVMRGNGLRRLYSGPLHSLQALFVLNDICFPCLGVDKMKIRRPAESRIDLAPGITRFRGHCYQYNVLLYLLLLRPLSNRLPLPPLPLRRCPQQPGIVKFVSFKPLFI